ncbi:MAG: TonB-dependent receptor domain-containing protein [Fidelibacterota bacterium]
MKRALIILVAMMPLFLFTQEFGKVSGKVVADGSGQALAGASVVIEGTSLGSAADEHGSYSILGVPVGTYVIRADYIGYQSVKVSNVTVSANLTTTTDFNLKVSAVRGDVVEIVAEKPLINQNATNTTRIVDSKTIQNLPLRGVEAVVALQTGTVSDDDNIYVRGSRAGDISYYVDGVYMNNSWDLTNTSTISNAAMEEVQFQSGGFSAEYGNVNGGVVNTTTRTGGDKFSLNGEFISGLGNSSADTEDGLYSYGYNLYNISAGGPLPIMDGVKYFFNFEGRTTDDPSPSSKPFHHIDRTEIDWGGISKAEAYSGTDSAFTYWTGDLMINNHAVSGWAEHLYDPNDSTEVWGSTANLDNILGDFVRGGADTLGLGGYTLVDVTKVSRTNLSYNGIDEEGVVLAGYANNKEMYGPKPNSGSDRLTFNGNLLFNIEDIRLKVGGLFNSDKGNDYNHNYSLTNYSNNAKYEESTVSLFANMTYPLSSSSYVKLNLSTFNYNYEQGDGRYWDDIMAYGTIGNNTYLVNWGQNPTAIQGLANFTGYGAVFDDYTLNETKYFSLKGDYLNQVGDHEIKAGFDYRKNTIKYYRVAQPIEIAERYHLAEENGTTIDDQWTYLTYMNAYTENLGYSITGDDSGVGFQEAGKPIILGMYIQDKIELEDMIVNIGLRYDSFDAATQEAADWRDIWLTDGHIDRDLSGFSSVDAESYISPRIGFSFPVTDQTKFHAQYGKYTQHPILSRLYMADSRLAANLTQGNMTVSPNPSLKPERTTQYEIGFTQQVGGYAALDITGFYKEVRDYTMMTNLDGAMKNGSEFIWAQYVNGDFGVVKGISLNLNMRRVNGLMVNGSYTLSFAEGTGSDPVDNWNIAWTGDQYPTMINPLSYDQRHTGSIMLDYRLGAEGGLLANTGINLLYQFGSGTAFTPSRVDSDVFGRGWYVPVAAVNSAYKPWTSTLDLKVDRDVQVGAYSANIFLWVNNLLNTTNVDEVFVGTGDAASDGYLSTQEGKVWATGNPDVVDFYNAQLRDPRNWGEPRQVRFGVQFDL